MTLEIFFKNRNFVSLILKDKQKTIDTLDLEFDRNLDSILISGLDKILNKNKMSLSSLKRIRIAGEIRKDSLSYQIAQSFKKALG
ncbi:MAG: hypothetical protein Q8R55_04325 [Candidatus Taylorbacteria bacterium]|nr:hypothetical protein [Candidatus Taylorbacteria bacterium]